MTDNSVYSDKITKGFRTYFFDINKSEKDDYYLKISESKKTASGYDRHHILVFDEDLTDFATILDKTLKKLNELKAYEPTDGKAYSVDKVRQVHKQAYAPWTKEDDSKLEVLFCEGKKTKELAQLFGRNEGAISSRIKKLELREKYGR